MINTGIAEAMKSLQRLSDKANGKQKFEVFPKFPEPKKQPKFVLTDKILWNLFKKHSKGKYNLTNTNKYIVFTILRYFLGNENFNEYKLIKSEANLSKGLLIFGSNGVGKSYLFEIIHSIGKELMIQANCNDLWFRKVTARKFVDDYMGSTSDKKSNFSLKTYYKGALYIDDLGFEEKAFNKTELFSALLFERERNNCKTFVTTNSSPSELSARYGRQIADRLPQMFNIIKWEGESYRG